MKGAYESPVSIRFPCFLRWSTHARRLTIPSLTFLAALPVYAQSTGSDPWDNAVNVLKAALLARSPPA